VITPGDSAMRAWEGTRLRFEQEAAALEAAGAHEAAASLRALVQEWWNEQEAWNARLAEVLGVHHEINNALVGIRGNAQLLLMNPAVQQQGIRERLEVVLRESGRIQEATGRLRELKTGFGGSAPRSRAA
jgi:nitrogen-specific signal transduction histidine kinase